MASKEKGLKVKEEDKWILEHDCIYINKIAYYFRCVWSYGRKSPNDDKPSIQLVFNIYKEGHGWINWDDFKGSYFAEKFTDYIKNSINGQRTVYWGNEKEVSFK